HPFV
ncbi:hypothetical protein BVZ62_01014B, partial [Haemophilus influenzae]